ncbi:hypothetical protein T484DRAFT_1781287 [Baffinella frigidus]|nr:hypothetical protein T484DRAFT_1781287 [Cryptophyta sp. CCMP2293]
MPLGRAGRGGTRLHESSALRALLVMLILSAAPPTRTERVPDGGQPRDARGGGSAFAALGHLSVGIVVGVDDGYEAWSDAGTVAWAALHPPPLAASAGLQPSVRLFCLGRGAAETGEVPAGTRAVECPAFLWGEDGMDLPLGLAPGSAAPAGETLAAWAGQRDVVVSIGRVVAREICVALAHRRSSAPAHHPQGGEGGTSDASRVGCVAVAAGARAMPGQDTWHSRRSSELEVWVQGPEVEQTMRAAIRSLRPSDPSASDPRGAAGSRPRVVLVPWTVPDFVAHAAPLSETRGGQPRVAGEATTVEWCREEGHVCVILPVVARSEDDLAAVGLACLAVEEAAAANP